MPLSRINAQSLADRTIVASEIADGAITTAKLADNCVTTAKITDNNITDAKINAMSSSKLSGALPAISGASLTGIDVLSSGMVLNTVSTYHDTSTNLSTSFVTRFTGTITPSATNSKILILTQFCVDILGDSSCTAKVVRHVSGSSATDLPIGNHFAGAGNFGSSNQHGLSYGIHYLDSPNTTNEIDYDFQILEAGNSSNVLLSHSGHSSMLLMEIKG